MNFDVWCFQIVDGDGWKASFQKVVRLPFVPFVKLMVTFDDIESDFFCISHVEWSVENNCFWCNGEREDSECTEQECTDSYLRNGWTKCNCVTPAQSL